MTLIDRNNYHQFQPLLYQVATAQVTTNDVATPLRGVFRKTKEVIVKKATVTAIDPETRTVSTAEGTRPIPATTSCSWRGAVPPNHFGVPGAEEHAFPLYSLRDAERLRARIFEKRSRTPTPGRRSSIRGCSTS